MAIFLEACFQAGREGRALALGFFDGVHRGHLTLLRAMRETASARKLRPTVFTFQEAPGKLFSPDFRGLLQTQEDRFVCLQAEGAEDVVAAPLLPEIYELEAETFLRRYFLEAMSVKAAFVGADFRFGRKAGGTTELLSRFCREEGIVLEILPDACFAGDKLSSTRIRSALKEGKAAEAAEMLGRPFSHKGCVLRGKQLGRRLGFPTLNIAPEPELIVPRLGVYLSEIEWQGKRLPAVTNLGYRPTVECSDVLRSESYAYAEEVPGYGESIRVNYLEFLRPEQPFPSVESLREQVLRDKELAACRHAVRLGRHVLK